MICPHCAFPNDPGVRVCIKCRKAFNDAPADALAEVVKTEAQPIHIGSQKQAPDFPTTDTRAGFAADETQSMVQEHGRTDSTGEPSSVSWGQNAAVQPSARAAVRLVWVSGFWLRSLALVVDVLVVTGVMFVMVAFSWLLRGGAEDAFGFFVKNPKALLLLVMMYLFLMGTYLALFTRFGGQTLGQMLLRLQVIHETGQPLTNRQVLRRMVGMVLAALPGLAGFLWVGFDLQRRGWHDYIGQSLVIRLRPPTMTHKQFNKLRDLGA